MARIRSLAADLGLNSIHAYAADSTQILAGTTVTAIDGGPAPTPPLLSDTDEETDEDSVGGETGNSGSSTTAAAAVRRTRPPVQEPSAGSLQSERIFEGDGFGRAGGHPQSEVALQRESFDRVLLDAPCSALGLRPRLLHTSISLKQLRATARYQRALLYNAVRLLKPGGYLVYCTCTINPGESRHIG